MTLLTLPLELIEAILVCSCSPRTVTSVAQTCRTLHTLVYGSPDSHLWRELFLTTWDDPRPALEHRALVDPRIDPAALDWGIEYRRRVSADKWLKAWRRDVCLADDPETAKNAETDWQATALSALSVVLDTLLTLRPFPATPPIALTVLTPATAISPYPTGNTGSGVGARRERMTSAPPLPPLLILLASGISVFEASRSGLRLNRTVYGPHASCSAPGWEAAKLELVPTPSLPPQLVRTLFASHTVGVRGLPAYAPSLSGVGHLGVDALGDVFHRIICITGFVPIPPPLVSTLSCMSPTSVASEFISEHAGFTSVGMDELKNPHDTEEHQKEDDHPEADEQPMRQTPEAFPLPLQQHADARILARRKVYDMQYLRGDRLWGPFQVVTREPPDTPPGASRLDDDRKGKGRKHGSTSATASGRGGIRRLGPFAWAMGVDIDPDELDSGTSSDDSKDEDWRDPADPSTKASSALVERGDRERDQGSGSEDTVDADIDVDMDPIESEHPLITLILDSTPTADATDAEPSTNPTSTSRRRTRRSNPRLPPNSSVSPRQIKPHNLRPDYAYLASVRIVVEANLRDLFGSEINVDVEPVSQARAGGVGMFWEDEDEILRARSSEPVTSSSQVSSSTTTTPSGIPAANTNPNTFELADILAQFENLEVARLGSACGYWGGWIERQQSAKKGVDEGADLSLSSSEGDIGARKPRIVAERARLERPIEGTSTTQAKGKGKEREREPDAEPEAGTGLGDWEIGLEGEACDGWDWAGVAGIWRRCVCWMDYRELLFFNLDFSKFLTLDTQEACRIIPMELRITGYTRAGLMPVYDTDERDNINVLQLPNNRRPNRGICTGYFRPPPVIHFSGAAIGSDRNMDDGRKVRGSVHLIGGGEVRWQMDTYTQGSDSSASSTPEWSSEAVQIGGIGSAVGVLGMWTGAEHERADPLGPFWAWKVA